MDRWTKHFTTVLNHPSSTSTNSTTSTDSKVKIPQPTSSLSTEKPSLAEVKKAIKSRKTGKAPGPDGIPVELQQADLDTAARELYPIISERQIAEER